MVRPYESNLTVYYGLGANSSRWDQETLDRIQDIIGDTCHSFDAIQADFYIDPEKIPITIKKLIKAGYLCKGTYDEIEIGNSM